MGPATPDIVTGLFIAAHAGQHDAVERCVRLSVTATVETDSAAGLPRTRRDRRDATQGWEYYLGAFYVLFNVLIIWRAYRWPTDA